MLVAVSVNGREYSFFPLQVDDTEVIGFLLQTEIIPLCLRTMEMGSELSKTVGDQAHLLYFVCKEICVKEQYGK